MVRQIFIQSTAPPGLPTPLLAVVARKTAAVLLHYARAKQHAVRQARATASALPVREFGAVQLHGQTFGVVYENGEVIAVIPDVARM